MVVPYERGAEAHFSDLFPVDPHRLLLATSAFGTVRTSSLS